MWWVGKVLKMLGEKTIAGIAIFFATMYEESQTFKLWGSITMQDEHLGFWSFSIFFEYYIRQGRIFPHLSKLLLKAFGKNKF